MNNSDLTTRCVAGRAEDGSEQGHEPLSPQLSGHREQTGRDTQQRAAGACAASVESVPVHVARAPV